MPHFDEAASLPGYWKMLLHFSYYLNTRMKEYFITNNVYSQPEHEQTVLYSLLSTKIKEIRLKQNSSEKLKEASLCLVHGK